MPHEVLLTVWDGISLTRKIEGRLQRLRSRRRPNVTELMAYAREVGP